jgi:hypothetical protein
MQGQFMVSQSALPQAVPATGNFPGKQAVRPDFTDQEAKYSRFCAV